MRSQRRGLPIRPVLAALAFAVIAASSGLVFAHPGHPTQAIEARQDRDREPPLLTDEDINLLHVYEVRLNDDPPPRIDIPKPVLEEFLKEYQADDRVPRGDAQKDFLAAPGHEQLEMLFKVRARSYYGKVRVRSTVASLKEWGNVHRRYVLPYFHANFSDGKVKGLYLFGQGRERERIEMTNFYILTQVQIDGKRLIDRTTPEESLLLQWGLPREDAKFPAPDVNGWRPYFKGTDDQRFKDMVAWVESLIRLNQGTDYGIEYRIPGQPREAEGN